MPDTTAAETLASVIEVADISTLKAIAEQPAMLSNLAYANVVANTNISQQNAVANQQAVNELGISLVAKAANLVANLGPLEPRSAREVLTASENLAETLADLKATLANFRGTRVPATATPSAEHP